MTFIGFLYSLVGIIALFGYLPQIITLTKAKTPCLDVNIQTWCIWLTSWVISLIYGIIELHDLKFSAVALINVAGHCGILFTTIYKRKKYSKEETILA
ncbi:MAG: hypothetical protein ACRBDI_09495 [Alphaproteobacteria bacterium]